MKVMIGSARIDENGNAHGGKAGDQKNGFEVSTQEWYKHSKGWRVFRCKDRKKAEKIAKIMEWACESDLIGYDQYQRNTLYSALQAVGWKLGLLKKNVETDCSAATQLSHSAKFVTPHICSVTHVALLVKYLQPFMQA